MKTRAAPASPKNSNWPARGTPSLQPPKDAGSVPARPGLRREYASPGSNPAATPSTSAASAPVSAKIEMQSSDRQAGTTPRALSKPTVGFSPTRLLNAAGTRPEPAVSVPSEKLARPAATATAEPELDPPDTNFGLKAFSQAPYGERVPTRPVANWSRLVLPIAIAPASSRAWTTGEFSCGT